jgi:hypothetical protein
MKYTIIALLITGFLLPHTGFTQNVGIGTTTPTEKLDVDGNINVTGTIKANGVDGAANQVLMKNGSGALVWADMCEYKNMATFFANGTWIVPAGVTKILVEVWGAGGGGSSYGGGGGGGYARAIFSVTPGNSINISIGIGGNGGGTTSSNGGTTQVTAGLEFINASGGSGSGYNAPTATINSTPGGTYAFTAGFTNHFGMRGEAGKENRNTFIQNTSTSFYEVSSDGDGGNAANSINTGGPGAYRMIDAATTLVRNRFAQSGKVPGGGGGGGYSMLTVGGFGNGTFGGDGMVVIHY